MPKPTRSPQKIADLLTPKESQVLIRSLRAALVSGAESYDGLVGTLVDFPVFLDVPRDWKQRLAELPTHHENYLDLSKDFLDEGATEPVQGPNSVRMMWQPHSILKEGWDELYETPEEYLASLDSPANQKSSDGDVD